MVCEERFPFYSLLQTCPYSPEAIWPSLRMAALEDVKEQFCHILRSSCICSTNLRALGGTRRSKGGSSLEKDKPIFLRNLLRGDVGEVWSQLSKVKRWVCGLLNLWGLSTLAVYEWILPGIMQLKTHFKSHERMLYFKEGEWCGNRFD